MPVGLQIVARRNMETDVIRAASAYERAQSKDYNVRHFNA
jgi:Asp-tRNA(Asn)/Glu-tRNA(Gln) amidotransferase A subunit family amidase